jgi:hypothetical protein
VGAFITGDVLSQETRTAAKTVKAKIALILDILASGAGQEDEGLTGTRV